MECQLTDSAFRHIAEDLTGMHVHHKDVGEMTEEEKSFYYFKIHDSDNNDNLDGLEMLKAAIHRHDSTSLGQEELSHIISKFINLLLLQSLILIFF
jgi:hypothetical protein